ncbi:hypothetical protein T484DRAFT_1828078, partial [Baffinella frigidus]
MPADAPTAFGDDFGQKVDLTSRIREILVNYPAGTTVLKEFVQNADDGGAGVVRFCIDERTFPTATLAHERLAAFQGPSLLVFNDGVFTDRDFESIQNIGDSQKKSELAKTGRFGIGFNSCYHLTELPSFLSRSSLIMFDPQAKFLPGVNPANPGKKIDVLSPSVQEHFPDQIEPFRAFGSDLKSDFKATLFRLPLRTEHQALTSKLSHTVHSPAAVLALLESFCEEARQSLLFLKNIARVDALRWREGAAAPEPLWSCRVDNLSKKLADLRAVVPESASAIKSKKLEYAEAGSDYDLDISEHHGASATGVVSRWTVAASVGGKESLAGKMAADPGNFHLRLVPWVGVAALVSVDGKTAVPSKGRAFCFLPLPAETGLPVHVNGYFELSSNRRDIWRGDDMAGEGRIRAEWNKALLEDVVAPTYARMLLRLSKTTRPETLPWYHSLWPSDTIAEPWASLARRVYSEVVGLPVLYSTVAGGRWAPPSEALYVEDGDFAGDVRGALLDDAQPVVLVPQWVWQGFRSAGLPLFQVSPGWFRYHVIENRGSRKHFVSDRARAIRLLQYALLDLKHTAGAQSLEGKAYASLCGLPLVPVSDGTFTDLREVGKSDKVVYVAIPLELEILFTLRASILDLDVPASVLEHMRCEAMQTYCNVKTVTGEIAGGLLGRVLPEGWKGLREARWRAGEDGQPSEAWMKQFWQYAGEGDGKRVGAFEGWPLVPTCDGTLCLLSKESTTVVDGTSVFGERLKDLLSCLGCRMLNTHLVQKREAVEGYVWKASLKGVLGALKAANAGEMERLCDRIGALTVEDKREMRAFLLQRRWLNTEQCDEQDAALVLALPIHEKCGGPEGEQALGSGEKAEEGAGFSAAAGCRLAAPGVAPSLLSLEYLRVASEGEWEAYKYLGVAVSKLSSVYVDSVFPRLQSLPAGVCEEAMLVMMGQLPQLCREDSRFWDRLSHVEFVRTAKGKLARPWELYDPSVAELHDLLEGGELYPSEAFLRPEYVATLVRLGLQTSLDRGGVVRIAQSIDSEMASGGARVGKRALALLRFLDVHFADLVVENALSVAGKRAASGIKNLMSNMLGAPPPAPAPEEGGSVVISKGGLDIEVFKQQLLRLAWLPVLTECPTEGLPWTDGRFPVATPGVAAARVSSPELRVFLGWAGNPDSTLVAAQLVKLTEMPDIAVSPGVQESLNSSLVRIYSVLQAAVENAEEFLSVAAVLKSHRWVWLGDDFTLSDTVAFKCSLNARPFLCAVPGELLAFTKLLRALGVREAFAARDYRLALLAMAAEQGKVA